jgi:aspartate aminotransferase
MKLAQRLDTVAPSATLALAQRAREMQAEGRDVVSLTAGEPDCGPPDHAVAAMKAALDRGETRYTDVPGIRDLRAAIADRTSRPGATYGANDVVVSAGAKQAIFNALLAVMNEGDEGVVLAPYWLSYADMIRIAGGRVVTVDTREEDGFVPDAAKIEAALTPRTKLLVMNSPSNPAGAFYRRQDLEAIASVLRRHEGVLILSDDIYGRFLFGETPLSLLDVAPDLAPRTIVVDGCSKTYAMTGLRVGWAVGPKPIISAMTKLQGQSTSNVCTPAQYAALAALTGDQGFVARMLESFDARRRFVVGRLRAIPNVTCFDPKGAFYVFPSLERYVGRRLPDGSTVDDAFSICGHLLHAHGLVVVPGGPFGMRNHVRLSFATDMATLARGIDRLRAGLLELA